MRGKHVSGLGLLVLFAVGAACGGSGGGGGADDLVGPSDGSAPLDGGGLAPDSDLKIDGGACSSATDCAGGVCVAGGCCPSIERVCGTGCCAVGAVCLFDKCVSPGNSCFTNNDCKSGQYCETALGAPPGPTKPGCFDAPPRPGKCLDLPPICADGVAPGTGGCVARCEYHPGTGKLDAVPKWTWGPSAKEDAAFVDVWATPAIGRVFDANCDGKVNELDPPDVIFVAGNAEGTCCQCNKRSPTACHTGVLRMLNGRDGKELWTLAAPSAGSSGFAGASVAIGDVDGDKLIDVVAVTGEGFVVIVDRTGKVVRTSDKPIVGASDPSFGWGGAVAIADMDGDGAPEIAYDATVYTTAGGGLRQIFEHPVRDVSETVSTFVDLDGAPDGHLELVVGETAYRFDGSTLWDRGDLGPTTTFPAIADFNKDGKPEVAITGSGKVWILDGATGKTVLGPGTLAGIGNGGPPTVSDFDGDGFPEIGVAMATFYSVMKPNFGKGTIDLFWRSETHDLSSSVTGSSVFDFEGDGRAEVVYNDECFLHVYDGVTGKERFTGLTTSFTATEASLVADVDGDGHAEIVMISNGADPSSAGWKCNESPWNKADPTTGRPAWTPPAGGKAYRGITVWGDSASSWVGTRTLWSEHTYHVSNICDDRDSACDAPNVYGSIPAHEKKNWTVPWLNDFRQNVQDKGIFDAPNATLSLSVRCATPPVMQAALRNGGLSSLPAGVAVGFYVVAADGSKKLIGTGKSTRVLYAGQTEEIPFTAPPGSASASDTFVAEVIIDPLKPSFHECRSDDDGSAPVKAACTK